MNTQFSYSDIWVWHFPGCFLWSRSKFHSSFYWSYSIDLSMQYWDFWSADSMEIKSRFWYNKIIVGPSQKIEDLERKIREKRDGVINFLQKEIMQIMNASANVSEERTHFSSSINPCKEGPSSMALRRHHMRKLCLTVISLSVLAQVSRVNGKYA